MNWLDEYDEAGEIKSNSIVAYFYPSTCRINLRKLEKKYLNFPSFLYTEMVQIVGTLHPGI